MKALVITLLVILAVLMVVGHGFAAPGPLYTRTYSVMSTSHQDGFREWLNVMFKLIERMKNNGDDSDSSTA